jgi:iron(III) transport system permease protein
VKDGEAGALWVLWALGLAFLTLFVVYPLVRVFSEAGLEQWRQILAQPRWFEPARNTLLLTGLSTLSATLTGFIYAYGVMRGGLPFARFFSFIPVLHLVTPPFVGGLSFILLFGRQGLLTRTLFQQDLSLYGLPGLLIAQTLCFFPLAFLIIKGVFEGMNPSLEYAARDAGAGRLRVFRTVTLPLTAPALVSAALLIAISALSDFGNPLLIGGRFNVLAVELYAQLTGWAGNTGRSAALGIILLVPAFVLFAVQRILSGRGDSRLATLGSRTSALPLPPPAWPVRVFLFGFCALVALVVAAQFLAMLGGAFSRIWGLDPRITLDHLAAAFSYGVELSNTLRFAFLAAALTAALGALLAFLVLRTALPFRRFAGTAAMVPAAVPGSLLGLAYVLAFNGPPLSLTGTALIILLAMTVSDLPAAYRILSSSIQRIRVSLDDSARALGASRLRLFRTVICPLAARGLVSAFVFSFVRSSGTLSAVIFLVGFKTKLSSVLILNLAAQGDWGRAAALALILTALIFVLLGLLRFAGGRRFLRGEGALDFREMLG